MLLHRDDLVFSGQSEAIVQDVDSELLFLLAPAALAKEKAASKGSQMSRFPPICLSEHDFCLNLKLLRASQRQLHLLVMGAWTAKRGSLFQVKWKH